MRYYADLYLTYLRFVLKSSLEYRTDFFIQLVGGLLHDGSILLFLSVVFANIRQLQGWTYPEAVLIWSLAVTGRNLGNTFFDVPHRIGYYVHSGDLDRLLVRPARLLAQIAGESGITMPAIGRVIIGVFGLLTVLPQLDLPWWSLLYLPVAVLSGALIMVSVQMLIASLSFWVVNVTSALQTIAWMNSFGLYPVTIFALPLQILFTWVLPYAMMGFFPAAFVLRGEEYRLYGLLAPLVAVAFWGLALTIWNIGLKHYQSTGS